MALEYNREDYEFTVIKFTNPFPVLNPQIQDRVVMHFKSKKLAGSIEGLAKSDFTGFKDGADPRQMKIEFGPVDPDKIWTEALIYSKRIIPCGTEDKIRIQGPGMPLPKDLSLVLKEEHHTPAIKRALIGIKETDRLVRKVFPGYCLTEQKIE